VIRAALAKLRGFLPDFRDVHAYGGGILLAFGAWQVYPPAAWMLAGLLLLYLGLRRP